MKLFLSQSCPIYTQTRSFLTGYLNQARGTVMAVDTTTPSYWLNWRFLLCAVWILSAMFLSAILIWRYEGSKNSRTRHRGDRREKVGTVYKDEAWMTCSKKIHPLVLLAYRVIAFGLLLTILISDAIDHSPRIFRFYTEWTFTLVTFYFGLASIFSICRCLRRQSEVGGAGSLGADAEQGNGTAPQFRENAATPTSSKSLTSPGEPHIHQTADIWGYAFQIIFQTCAGAVVLTDIVFWFIIYPFLTAKSFRLHLLSVCMHSVNAVVLLGEVTLNSLCFPFFRVAYFVLWTCAFVIFQWILHAFVLIRWPYPFLDLSSSFAPVWYLGVGLLTLPCFAVFAIIIRIKKFCWSRILPESSLNLR